MRRSERLNLADVRALLRLCNGLHESEPEPAARKVRLLAGVCGLTGADGASVAVASFDGDGAPPAIISVVHAGGGDREPPAHAGGGGTNDPMDASGAGGPGGTIGDHHGGGGGPPWSAFRRHQRRRELRRAHRAGTGPADHWGPAARETGWCTTEACTTARPAPGRGERGGGQCVHSFLPLAGGWAGAGGVGRAGGAVVACLSVRRGPGRRRFSPRERAIVCALHAEAGWVYRTDVMLASPGPGALSRRQQETLRHLLAGRSEKQAAAEMGLSPNTIHHYIKALHRHFGVSSRSELLARWVGR